MADDASVTEWLYSLKAGCRDAAQKLFERYLEQVVVNANRRLGRHRRAVDGHDVAQEVFATLFRSIKEGRFPRLNDRNDLWQVLLMLTDRKAKQHLRQQLADKRGAGKVRGESAFAGRVGDAAASSAGIGQLAAKALSPKSVDDVIRVLRSTLEKLPDDEMRQIAIDKLQGYSDKEIATRRGMALRTVERKLNLIRKLLQREEEP